MTKNKDKYQDAETWMKDIQIDTIDKYKQLYKALRHSTRRQKRGNQQGRRCAMKY